MRIHNNLSEHSVSYYSEADIYQMFSNAEDYPQYILKELIPLVTDKDIIDIGCGNGKYISLLNPYVRKIIATDKSLPQLSLAKQFCDNKAILFQSDATALPLPDNYVDIVLSCWMLGTVNDRERQKQAIKEMKRISKQSVILVENSLDSEFEILRGRSSLVDNRTKEYNDFLFAQDFIVHSHIDTYFQFLDAETAQHVFSSIWKNRLIKTITKNIIEHGVDVLIYNKN